MDRRARRNMERLASMPMPELNPIDFFSWRNLFRAFMARRAARSALVWQDRADRIEDKMERLGK